MSHSVVAESEMERFDEILRFPGIAVIGAVEDLLDKSCATEGDEPPFLCLDLSDTEYIETATLQLLTAFVTARKHRGLRTRMKLPAGARGLAARQFMRRWEYPAALRTASGIAFDKFVVDSDLHYFRGRGGDPSGPYDGQLDTYYFPNGEVSLRHEAHRFFAFSSWPTDRYEDPSRLVAEARNTWQYRPIMAVLDRHLARRSGETDSGSGAPSLYLASRVVYEALTNAVRHPHARIVQAASQLQPNASREKISHFTLVFWDDGAGMLETVRTPLSMGRPIRADYSRELDEAYLLRIAGSDGKIISEEVIHSSATPDSAVSEEALLLATLFPGISCDPEGLGRYISPELERTDPRLAKPGMGLFVLINTAIKMFRGTVAVRTGRLFMNVRAPKPRELRSNDVEYVVKVQRKSPHTPEFLGNMITIRIPVES